MSFWTAVVIIVAISAFVQLRTAKYRHRSGLFDGRADNGGQPALPSPREEELQREVSDLRERIKVLERIATDGRKTSQLADEIESLRDR